MKAMILAAGLGTRLRPLTDTRPKALAEIDGRTLLEITLTRLRAFGVTEAIINVHHFAGMVVQYLKSKNNFGMRLEISREDDQLLDTGGGLKKAAWFFEENSSRPSSSPSASAASDEPFLLHNVDVISAIDLAAMFQFHKENHALATLAVQSRQSSRQLLFNNQLQLSGRRISEKNTVISSPHPPVISSEARNLSSPPTDARGPHSPLATNHSPLPPSPELSPLLPLAFSGIHILSPRLLPLLTETGPFSIIDSYLRLSSQGQKIQAFRHDNSYWRDLGKPADLAQAALELHALSQLLILNHLQGR
ncbi:MAG TPA: sugar phosphate nucleotidyltransferase [Candidatus Acidoferrum sp.]|nr:sugar phosphate nucleotidyltransferase [Candidatus Acidoferrum sp.]